MSPTFFIVGANGVGKSAIIPHLRAALPADRFDIRDFDERGVPERAGGEWRRSETAFWLETGERSPRHVVVCGFVKPEDFGAAQAGIGTDPACLLLDADPETLRARLQGRYTKNGTFDPAQTVIGKPVETFIAGNLYIRGLLRDAYSGLGCPVIDTGHASPAEVAGQAAAWIRARTEGR